MSERNRRACPYVGPRALREGERIFGRAREERQLFQLLVARRIALLHSPSGAGKTSLVQAGLLPKLRADGFHVLPVARLNKPLPGQVVQDERYNRYRHSLLLSIEEQQEAQPDDDLLGVSISDYLAARHGDNEEPVLLALIIDQFEQVLTLDPTDAQAKEAFFRDLGRALRNPRLWTLFVIREDYLGALEPYARAIPTHLAHTYRLDLLNHEAASEAIREPAAERKVTFTDEAVEYLVDDLRQIQVQKPDGAIVEQPGLYVEPVQLQVICRRLWKRLPASKAEITVEDVKRAGDVDRALAGYYADCIGEVLNHPDTNSDERTIRQWVQSNLISRDGVRLPVLMGSGKTEGLDNDVLRRLQDAHLLRADQRAGLTWYELAHDRLVKPIRKDNHTWFKVNLRLLQRQSERWQNEDRADYLLLHGEELAGEEEWAAQHEDELTDLDRAFLDASLNERSRRRQERAAQEEKWRLAQKLADEQRERAETERQKAIIKAELERRNRQRTILSSIVIVLLILSIALEVTRRARVAEAEAEAKSQTVLEGQLERSKAEEELNNAASQATAEQSMVRLYTIDESSLAVTDAAASATAVSASADATLAAINATAQVDAPETTATAAAEALMMANAAATIAATEPTATPTPEEIAAEEGPPTEEATPSPRILSERLDQLAFVSDRGDEGDSLYLAGVTASQTITNLARISVTDGYDWWPTWCNEATILFERGDDPWNTQRMQIMQVRLYADGRSAVTEPTIVDIPTNLVMSGSPSCAPQASRLAFSGRPRGAASNDFGIYTTFRGRPSRLGSDGYSLGGHVGWSPDGEEVVFMHYRRDDGRFHIYHLNLDRPNEFNDLTADMDANCKYPAWSPVSNQIAFACSTGSGEDRQWSLHVLSLEDGSPAQSAVVSGLHTGSELDEARQVVRHAITPSWSPDGQWIAYSSDRDGDWDIYLYPLDGGESINLTADLESDEFHPRWGP